METSARINHPFAFNGIINCGDLINDLITPAYNAACGQWRFATFRSPLQHFPRYGIPIRIPLAKWHMFRDTEQIRDRKLTL